MIPYALQRYCELFVWCRALNGIHWHWDMLCALNREGIRDYGLTVEQVRGCYLGVTP